jgi:hypothetical protein
VSLPVRSASGSSGSIHLRARDKGVRAVARVA